MPQHCTVPLGGRKEGLLELSLVLFFQDCSDVDNGE